MPIIINDFEVQVEPPAKEGPSTGQTKQDANAASTLKPEDVVRILRRQRERMLRLRAD